jgi:two-component system chemotaxis response regulator CheY
MGMLKILVVEDDITSSRLLQELLKSYGLPDAAANGKEAVEAVRVALEAGEPHDLICLDIVMKEMNGIVVLKKIRAMERERGGAKGSRSRVFMTTGTYDKRIIDAAFEAECDAYFVKPVGVKNLRKELENFKMIETE